MVCRDDKEINPLTKRCVRKCVDGEKRFHTETKYVCNKTRKNITKTSKQTLPICVDQRITDIDMTDIQKIINNNTYVKSTTTNKKRNIDSLSYLVAGSLSQSDCIKIGNGIEYVLRDIITNKRTSLTNIKPKNVKDKKERDHLFADYSSKIIYYAEIKSNLNLDTEKCRATADKCLRILNELQEEYPDYTIKMFLVGVRYCTKSHISPVIMKKYNSILPHVVGVNEYLSEIGIDLCFDEQSYRQIINYLVLQMFGSNNS